MDDEYDDDEWELEGFLACWDCGRVMQRDDACEVFEGVDQGINVDDPEKWCPYAALVCVACASLRRSA